MENWMKETDEFLVDLVDVLNHNFTSCVKNNRLRQKEIKGLRKNLIWLAVDVAILGAMTLGNMARIDKIEKKLGEGNEA